MDYKLSAIAWTTQSKRWSIWPNVKGYALMDNRTNREIADEDGVVVYFLTIDAALDHAKQIDGKQ